MESVYRRIVPEMYLEASVTMANGLKKLGRWRTGWERGRFFSKSNDYWQAGV